MLGSVAAVLSEKFQIRPRHDVSSHNALVRPVLATLVSRSGNNDSGGGGIGRQAIDANDLICLCPTTARPLVTTDGLAASPSASLPLPPDHHR